MGKRPNKGFTLWFTGLSGAGKSTVADNLHKILMQKGYEHIERLDGDLVRQNLTKDLGFTKDHRQINLERVTFVAKLLSRNETGVICSFISPYVQNREYVRNNVTNFIEVYVNAPLEVCEDRDCKGLYAKARRGEIKDFTGISDPYEAPINPEIELKTDVETIDQSTQKVFDYLQQNGFIN